MKNRLKILFHIVKSIVMPIEELPLTLDELDKNIG